MREPNDFYVHFSWPHTGHWTRVCPKILGHLVPLHGVDSLSKTIFDLVGNQDEFWLLEAPANPKSPQHIHQNTILERRP